MEAVRAVRPKSLLFKPILEHIKIEYTKCS
jgi:hypothetical protein